MAGVATAAMTDPRTILHVDMDAFYASVELLRHPELRGRPVVVGGAGARGVVAAASYEARSYGVYSAMPSVRARRMCPDAVFLDGDHPHYQAVSARVMALLGALSPLVEPLSLDEAFVDISGAHRRLGSGMKIAHGLRSAVFEQEGLHCSVGIATSKFVAKLATNRAKPKPSRRGPVMGAGVHEVLPGTELEFLHALPVGALWGVGPATLSKLQNLGIATVADLAVADPLTLSTALGAGSAQHLLDLAHARDDRPVVPNQAPRSVSHEETFRSNLTSRDMLHTVLVRQSDAVVARLRGNGLKARTVTIKVRFGDFETISRSSTLGTPTDRGTDVIAAAASLLERVPIQRGVRLLGVGASGLSEAEAVPDPAPLQLSFAELGTDSDPAEAAWSDPADDAVAVDSTKVPGEVWDAANAAVDAIRDRFGGSMIRPARLAGQGERAASAQWGPSGPEPDGDSESTADNTEQR